jgi:serine/threonine-protein kinase
MVGQTVGKYRVESRLGRGGMGTVYRAVDETLGRDVAIKCLNPEIGEPELLKRFRAEAVTLARLNHPNIATLFELATHDGQLLMVMEFVRGETFDRVLQREGPMPVGRAAQLCAQVLDALEHAHRSGVVHRDLKPANLMLTESGLVKVMDFGLARMVGTEHLTNDGYMVGTPAYMSPEQVLGRDIDGRADIYAIGVVLFRLLTAELPFKADSGVAMVHRQLNDPPTPVRQVRGELSETCEAILLRALSKSADDRFQSADEFRTALTQLDPAVPLTGVSRISSVAPAPPAETAEAPSSVTVVLPRASELSSTPARTPTPPFMRPPTAAAAPTVSPPAAVSRRAALAPRALAGIAAAVVLLAGIPVTGVLWWRAHRAHDAAPAPAAAVPPPAMSPPSSAPASAAAAPAVAPAEAGAPSAAAPARPSAKDAGNSDVLPVLTFAKIRLLVLEYDKPRDRDASLRLGADALDVLDGGRTLESTSYQDVIGLFYSHSKEPRWAPADGQPATVMKVSGGFGFGFLRGTPDWITVRTRRHFIPLRVDAGDVMALTRALEARTGARLVTVR